MSIPEVIFGWQGAAVFVTVVGTIYTVHRNNRFKAAELLLSIEKEYSKHIHTLLMLENLDDYKAEFQRAIKISIYEIKDRLNPEESKAIDNLEAALRHFYVSTNVKSFGIDRGGINKLYAWYLRVLVTDIDDENVFIRPELREYIRRYWPKIYFWALLATVPWHVRIIKYFQIIPERLKVWSKAEWAAPPIEYRRISLRTRI